MELSKKNVLNVFSPFLWWNSAKELIRGKAAPAHRGYYTMVRRYWFYFRVAKQWARSIQPKFPEISVQNSMNRFGPTGKVSKKRVHLLRWTTFPGWTGWNFGWMDRAQCDFVLCRKQWKFFLRLVHHISRNKKSCESEDRSEYFAGCRRWNHDSQTRSRFHSWINYVKSECVCASVTCTRNQIAFKWSVNFRLQVFSIRWDGRYIFQWIKFLWRYSPNNSRKLCLQGIHCSLRKQKCRLKSTTTNGWRLWFWPIGTAQIIRIVSYPIRKKSSLWLFCMWSVKGLHNALLPKTDYRDIGREHDSRLRLR